MDKALVSNSTFNGVKQLSGESYSSAEFSFFQTLQKIASTKTFSDPRPDYVYDIIEETLKFLPSLDPEEADYIQPEAAARALNVLHMLRHARVPAPRIIPGEDGDDVTFTWDSQEMKRFLTIALDNWNVTHLHRPTKKRVFKKYTTAIKKPNDVLAEIGQPAAYSPGVTSY